MDCNQSEIKSVLIQPLRAHADSRGCLIEIFNTKTNKDFKIAQLNYVNSVTNTFRGMHLHSTHSDYLFVISGMMLLALKDLRQSSATYGKNEVHKLSIEDPHTAMIPPGVAHGFYFPENTLYCYGLSHPWDASEHLGFRWNAPDAKLELPMSEPTVSIRDQQAGTVAELLQLIEQKNIYYE